MMLHYDFKSSEMQCYVDLLRQFNFMLIITVSFKFFWKQRQEKREIKVEKAILVRFLVLNFVFI